MRQRGQLELFPPPAHCWQTIGEIEALGEQAAAQALALHEAYSADPRAARAVFNALIMFGTAEVLRRRGYRA